MFRRAVGGRSLVFGRRMWRDKLVSPPTRRVGGRGLSLGGDTHAGLMRGLNEHVNVRHHTDRCYSGNDPIFSG